MSSKPIEESDATGPRSAGLGFSLRLSFYFAAFFALATIGLFGLAYLAIANTVEKSESKIVRERLDEYRAWFVEDGIEALEARFDEQSSENSDIMFLRLAGPDLNFVRLSVPHGAGFVDMKDFDRLEPGTSGLFVGLETAAGENLWMVMSEPLGDGVKMQVGKNSHSKAIVLEHFRNVFLVAVVPILLLGFGLGAILAFSSMSPIRQLIGAMQDILRTGDLSRRVEPRRGRNELNALVNLFNRLLGRNEQLIDAMQTSLDSVAHDLRTPLTRLRNTAETGFHKNIEDETERERWGECLEETDRVREMLDALMDLAEAQTGTMPLVRESHFVGEVLQEMAELHEFVAEEKGITIETKEPGGLEVYADPVRLRQVLGNLVDNAIKYSGENTTVLLSSSSEEGGIRIAVRDEGIGIPEAEQSRVWERLYRADASRSRGGLGLGLSFVRAVVEAHGGSVRVDSQVGKGSIFSVWLPGAPKPAAGEVTAAKGSGT